MEFIKSNNGVEMPVLGFGFSGTYSSIQKLEPDATLGYSYE